MRPSITSSLVEKFSISLNVSGPRSPNSFSCTVVTALCSFSHGMDGPDSETSLFNSGIPSPSVGHEDVYLLLILGIANRYGVLARSKAKARDALWCCHVQCSACSCQQQIIVGRRSSRNSRFILAHVLRAALIASWHLLSKYHRSFRSFSYVM